LSICTVFGAPRTDAIRIIVAITCSPLKPLSTSIASVSRMKAMTTVSARNRRPSNSTSETKSIDHISLGANAAGWDSWLAALTLRSGGQIMDPQLQRRLI
jgi:hypothetical protein